MDKKKQMHAPVYEALEKLKKRRVVPFDVPGHKRGRGNPELVELLGEKCVSLDVNSMKPLDNLCHPVSVIKEAEELAAEAFRADHAFFMVGGTTSSVQGMVLSCCKAGDKIILPRNVHKSVINALVLCGAIPVYVNPEVDNRLGISLGMEVSEVEKAIVANPDAVAVLVNNPTYYGICSDLRSIVKIAHAVGVSVEAELGHVGQGFEYEQTRDSGLTRKEEAIDFVKQTNVDALAVSVGTSHGTYHGTPKLEFELLADLHQMVEVPLVLHGGSGTGDDNLKKAVQTGIQKVNLCTDLSNAGLETLKGYLQIDYDHMKKDGSLGEFGNKTANMFDLSNEMRIGYKEALKHYITLFGSVNKA